MNIRRANQKDIPGLFILLFQVNDVHHQGRPDLFKKGGRKYTENELIQILSDDQKPVFVATDGSDQVLGYAFCVFIQHTSDNILTDIRTLYIDDLCVDETKRGAHIGSRLYQYVLEYAKNHQCYNVTLNVWSLNESAYRFYQKCGLTIQKIGMEQIL